MSVCSTSVLLLAASSSSSSSSRTTVTVQAFTHAHTRGHSDRLRPDCESATTVLFIRNTRARATTQKKRGLSVCKCAPNKRLIELTTRSRSLYLSVPEVGHTRTAATHSHFIHHHPHPHCAIHHARTPLFRPAHYRTSARVGCIQPIDVRQKKTLKTTPTNHWLITQRNAQARARAGARQREQLCHVFDGASARAALIIERQAAARPRALIKVNSIYPTCPFVTRRRASGSHHFG